MIDNFYMDPVQEDILCMHRKSTSYHNCFHKHNGYEIYLLLNGEVKIYIEHSCYPIRRGTLCFFRPDQLHLAVCPDDQLYERMTINFNPEILSRLSTAKTDLSLCFRTLPDGSDPLGTLSGQKICEFADCFQKLKASANREEYGSDVTANAELSRILLLANESIMQRHLQPKNIMPELISDIMLYVEMHLEEPLTLDSFSSEFYLNGKYLSHRFREEMGITLQSYIISKRVVRAKTLLQRNMSVTETCMQSGFGNYSNFIRTFTAQVGMPPGKYQKMMRTTKENTD